MFLQSEFQENISKLESESKNEGRGRHFGKFPHFDTSLKNIVHSALHSAVEVFKMCPLKPPTILIPTAENSFSENARRFLFMKQLKIVPPKQ